MPTNGRVLDYIAIKSPSGITKKITLNSRMHNIRMGTTRENPTLVHVNNKGTGLSSYPRSPIRSFASHFFESIFKLATSKIAFFYLVSVAEQTSLSLSQ